MDPIRSAFMLDPSVVFLNHGSFGACPRRVFERQLELRILLEAEPVRFFMRELPERWRAAKSALADFVGAQPESIAFVPNATAGVNSVLRSLRFEPGDELLVTDHEYNACRNALDFVAERSGARVVMATIPFPLRDPGEVIESVLKAVTPRTRLALLDHVTSPTGLVLPIPELVTGLTERGVDTLVDGAHAPGMLDLHLDQIGATYYTGNCHKWICAPKGAGFLHVRRDQLGTIRPLSISHGANAPLRDGASRFQVEFDWTGTQDPTAALCVPYAIEVMRELIPGGWPEIRRRNRELALKARDLLAEALQIPAPAPDSMIGSLAALPLPSLSTPWSGEFDPLQDRLWHEHRIEVPITMVPARDLRAIRVSAQIYNTTEEYEALAKVLRVGP